MKQENKILKKENQELKQEMASLKHRKNSDNSSIPPSSDIGRERRINRRIVNELMNIVFFKCILKIITNRGFI